MKVHIYMHDRTVQILFEGSACGAVSFPDYNTFARFIQECGKLISNQSLCEAACTSSEIPRPFLDAFRETEG